MKVSQGPGALFLCLPVIFALLWRRLMALTSLFLHLLHCKAGAEINHFRVSQGWRNSLKSTKHLRWDRPARGWEFFSWDILLFVVILLLSVPIPNPLCLVEQLPLTALVHWKSLKGTHGVGHQAAIESSERVFINPHLFPKEQSIKSPSWAVLTAVKGGLVYNRFTENSVLESEHNIKLLYFLKTNCYRGNCRQISIPVLTSKVRNQPKPHCVLCFLDCQGHNIHHVLVLNKQT